jgi:hypothetical protein
MSEIVKFIMFDVGVIKNIVHGNLRLTLTKPDGNRLHFSDEFSISVNDKTSTWKLGCSISGIKFFFLKKI